MEPIQPDKGIKTREELYEGPGKESLPAELQAAEEEDTTCQYVMHSAPAIYYNCAQILRRKLFGILRGERTTAKM